MVIVGHEASNKSCSDADMGDCFVWFVVDFPGNTCLLCRLRSISWLAVVSSLHTYIDA